MGSKRIISAFVLLIFPLLVRSQEISVVANYPSVVRAGEQFAVSWIVNSGGGEFSAPSFGEFYKLMGPQTSYSSSTQIINGKVSRETTYTYVYYIQATREGKFVIAPATFVHKNKTYSSDSLRIEVVSSGTSSQTAAAPGAGNIENDEPVRETGDDIFLNLSLDKKEAFVGEHIVATVKIYTRVDISGINEIKFPDFQGFLRTDLNTPPLTALKRENVNGKIYGTGIVQQFLLYPQISGEILIDPVQITALVQQKTGQSDPFFGDFFSTYTTAPKAVFSPVVKVRVKPLPGNKPEDFSGIVGKLSLSASLDKDSVSVNDAVNLKIILSGSGNLKLANAPGLKLPADVEVYDPKVSDDLKNGSNGTSGNKSFEYLLIPRHYGEYSIPSASYSYFDISTRKYEKLTIPELHFYVSKGNDQNSGITVYGGVSKEDVKYLGKDIRFIQQKPGSLKKSGSLISSRRSFYSAYAFAMFVFLLVLFIRREHIRRNSDLTMVRNRKAAKIAGKRLKEANRCLNEGPADKFYDEILKAIWGYLSDKLNIPVSELTRSNAVNSLEERGIEEEQIAKLTSVLDTCEFARYAPSTSGTEAFKIYEEASQFISSVENSIIKK
jgi:hypothetical protein